MAAKDRSTLAPASIFENTLERENRSRNLLARVRSILSRMAAADPTASDFAAHLEGRLSALWRAEDAFNQNGADLELIILNELQTFGVLENGLTVKGPTVRLCSKASEVIVLAMHELATNALKFGALDGPEGRLDISWSISRKKTGRRLRLQWAESGVSVVTKAPRHKGFGYDLITNRIAYELQGSGDLVLNPGGVTCLIDIPL